MIPIVNTFCFSRKLTHSGDYALGAFASPPRLAYFYSLSKSECTKTNSTARTMAEILPKNIINLSCQLFYVDDFGNLIPIVNTHSVFSRKLTHILVTVPCQIRQSWALGRWRGRTRGRGEENKIWMKFKKNIFKFDKSGQLLAIAQNYLLLASLPLCSLLLTAKARTLCVYFVSNITIGQCVSARPGLSVRSHPCLFILYCFNIMNCIVV